MKFSTDEKEIIAVTSSASALIVAMIMPIALSAAYKTPWWLCLWLVVGPATGLGVALLKSWVDKE